MRCESLPGAKDCWADDFCKVVMVNGVNTCKFCKLSYHKRCLSQYINDSCGCQLLVDVRNQ